MTGGDSSVIISQCGAFHAWPAAQAAFKQGWLQKFVTTRPVREMVPKGKIRNLGYLEFPLRGLRYLNGRVLHSANLDQWHKKFVKAVQVLFDRTAAGEINSRTRIFHVFSLFQKKAVQRCEKMGVKRIMDYGTAHPVFFERIMNEEAGRLGLPPFVFRDLDQRCDELSRMDAICIPSRFVERTFRESGYSTNNLVLNSYGVDSDFFRPQGIRYPRGAPFRVITAGMLGVRKGTDYLMKAIKSLDQQGIKVELYLMGNAEGEFYDRVLKRYSEYITFMRTVPHADLPRYYSSADVFVLPSLLEGQARAVFEAMACGLPCIVTSHAGHDDTIHDEENGFLIPVRDSAAIAERIERLYQDPDLRSYMGRQARLTAEQHSWIPYQDGLINLYRGFLGNDGKTTGM